jgi:hypothetical protein
MSKPSSKRRRVELTLQDKINLIKEFRQARDKVIPLSEPIL